MKRAINTLLKAELKEKIVLLSGPRQVGKTTLSKSLFSSFEYFNYDSEKDRRILLKQEWNRDATLIVFDEVHKMKKWKSWLKGIYDTEKIPPYILVTGSARLNAYRKSGDSLAGRHYLYRLHPFTVKELKTQNPPEDTLERILRVGGFPEPFLKDSETAARKWRRGHIDAIIREDLLDLEKIREVKGIEILTDLLRVRVGSPTAYAALANELQVSIHTVKHWLQILEDLHVIFSVRPYHKNIARSILKEAKYYFYDTGSLPENNGQRLENAVACALLAESHRVEDMTGRKTSLCYLRDKEKREVDFLAVVDDKPSHLIEVKWDDENFSKSLFHFKKFFNNIQASQISYKLTRKKNSDGVKLENAVDFLRDLNLEK